MLFLALHREIGKRIINAMLEVKVDLMAGAQQQVQEMLRRFFGFFRSYPDEARGLAGETTCINADFHAVPKE